MNLGIVISYIIAGMILLSIAMMNIRVQNSSAELTITQIVREHVTNITEVLNDDLSNMGYDVDQSTLKSKGAILTYANDNSISFYRNLQNNSAVEPDLITWSLVDDSPSTGNPNIKTLVRTVLSGETGLMDENEIKVGVTNFELRYYDTVGNSLGNNMSPPAAGSGLSNIRQIHVILEVQSREPVFKRATGNGRFVRSVWEKRFTPTNLN